MNNSGLLIDWLTIRHQLGADLGDALTQRVRTCLGMLYAVDSDGAVKWQKANLDIEKLRSDAPGLFWTIQGDGKNEYLTIGASPASLEHGNNVFGTLDIHHAAAVLLKVAQKALSAILPAAEHWQCRRIDITGNYVLPDAPSVKQALRALLATDGVRRKASSDRRGGDSVYWNPSSDLSKGKAYHKGPQLQMMARKRGLELSAQQLDASQRLLRLEHTRGSRWFRRLEQENIHWLSLTPPKLTELYTQFFAPLMTGIEVKDMHRPQILSKLCEVNLAGKTITETQAKAAFSTYTNIKSFGFDEMKGSMPERTWFRHLRILRAAGFSDAQLCAGNVIPFQQVRILLAQPVASWEDIRHAA